MIDHAGNVYEAAVNAIKRGEPAALAMVVDSGGSAPRDPGAKMLVYGDGRTVGTVGGGPAEAWVIDQALQALSDGRSCLLEDPVQDDGKDVCGRDMRFFVDVLLPPPTLLIIGAGHIGQAVASMGAWLGYRVAVLDQRADLVSADRIPEADVLLSGPVHEKLREFPLTRQTYAVLVTPHGSPDEKALSVLARYPVAYVGLLGGSRRSRATFQRARDLGVPGSFLDRVHTPIGLDIHAETPREIALSILADVTGVRRKNG